MPGWIIECKGCGEIIFTGIVSDTLESPTTNSAAGV